MIRVGVVGACGRMGEMVCRAVAEADEAVFAEAVAAAADAANSTIDASEPMTTASCDWRAVASGPRSGRPGLFRYSFVSADQAFAAKRRFAVAAMGSQRRFDAASAVARGIAAKR